MLAAAAAAAESPAPTPPPPRNLPALRDMKEIRDFCAVPRGAQRITNIVPVTSRRVQTPTGETYFCFSDRLFFYDPTLHSEWILWSPVPDDGKVPLMLFDRVTKDRHFRGQVSALQVFWTDEGGPSHFDLTYAASGLNGVHDVDAQLHCAFCAARVDPVKPNKCSKCRVIRYCCREHQEAHWPIHHQICERLMDARSRVPLVKAATPKGVSPEHATAIGAFAGKDNRREEVDTVAPVTSMAEAAASASYSSATVAPSSSVSPMLQD